MKIKVNILKLITLVLTLLSHQNAYSDSGLDFPSSADIKASWESHDKIQEIKISPIYGTISINGVAVPPITVKVRLNKFYQDSDLEYLNMYAAEVWQNMVNCHGSVESAINAYAKNEVCTQALDDLKALAKNINQYLSSTFLDSYRDYHIECDDSKEHCKYLKMEIASLDKGSSVDVMIRQIEQELTRPLFHPLFIQLVLDESFSGFPLKKVEKKCARFPCWGQDDYFYLITTDSLIEEARIATMDEVIHNQSNESSAENFFRKVSGVSLDDVKTAWQDFRKMRVAIEILGSHALGKSNCQSWGLLTKENNEIINAMSFSQGRRLVSLPRIKSVQERACGIAEAAPRYYQMFIPDAKLNELYITTDKIEKRKAKIQSLLH